MIRQGADVEPVMPGGTVLYTFEVPALQGGTIRLADFAGQVLLIVNTASQCGFTPQYAGLQALQAQYGERGLRVIGCPCNQFGGQEPGGPEEIGAFCGQRFGVSFAMTDKLRVNGPDAHPLFQYLTSAAPGVLGSRAIKWNFTKFLVDRTGAPVRRYAPTTAPADLAGDIEALL